MSVPDFLCKSLGRVGISLYFCGAIIDKFLLGKKEIGTSHILKAPWNF
jgi:hypothetical protein